MHVVLVYDSKFGNTELIARSIADGLGEGRHAQLVRAEVGLPPTDDVALLIVGCPTQRHGLSPAMKQLLRSLPSGSLASVPVATFDTRYHLSRWLSGSAARVAQRRLRRTGCRFVAPPESFFMQRDRGSPEHGRTLEDEGLEPGEVERARIWGERLSHHLPPRAAQPAGS